MPVTLMSNPGLHLAVLGNPGGSMAARRKSFPSIFKSRKHYRRTLWGARRKIGANFMASGRIPGLFTITGASVARKKRHAKKSLFGLPWSGRTGTVRYRARIDRGWGNYAKGDNVYFTNPNGRDMRRRNPMNLLAPVKGYVASLPRVPAMVMSSFKGKGMVKNLAFAAGGAAVTSVVGNMAVSNVVAPVLGLIPGGAALLNGAIGSRVIRGLAPYTVGYVGANFVKGDMGRALLVGGAVASIIELIVPGRVSMLLNQGLTAVGLPGIGAYVDAAAYQGTGAYVDAAAYQGTGAYVDAAAYQGTGRVPALAGPGDYAMAGVPGMAGSYLESGSYLADGSYL